MLFRATAKLGLMHQSPTAPPWVTEAIPLPRNTRPGCGANGPPTTAARRTLGADTTPGALAASAAAGSCGAGLMPAEVGAALAATSNDPRMSPLRRRDMAFLPGSASDVAPSAAFSSRAAAAGRGQGRPSAPRRVLRPSP